MAQMLAPFSPLPCRTRHTYAMTEGRVVYSTGIGKVCPGCGWPAKDCKCSSKRGVDQSVPGRIVAKLRMEKKGRGGKTVTVVYDLPQNEAFLKDLAQELKRACGTGGAVADNTIELQGDLRDRVRECLSKKGWQVKG
jgi:translation initiation factor 1